jgi:hypothetical protein
MKDDKQRDEEEEEEDDEEEEEVDRIIDWTWAMMDDEPVKLFLIHWKNPSSEDTWETEAQIPPHLLQLYFKQLGMKGNYVLSFLFPIQYCSSKKTRR